MSDKTIEQRAKDIICEQLGVSQNDLEKPETHIVNDLGANSLDEVELVMALEDEFEIEIPDEVGDAPENKTVGAIVRLLTERVK